MIDYDHLPTPCKHTLIKYIVGAQNTLCFFLIKQPYAHLHPYCRVLPLDLHTRDR